MIDKRPALTVRCKDVADVITAVNFGRAHRMPVAIRAGACDEGPMIDLSPPLSLISYWMI